jgi:hypothetical protein
MASMTPLAAVVAVFLLGASACAHERLVWRFPDGSYDSRQLAEDVDACEAYTVVADDEEFVNAVGAREYGGWGNFTFEYCMNKRGWTLTSVPRERADRG